jgi:hypothetical protein
MKKLIVILLLSIAIISCNSNTETIDLSPTVAQASFVTSRAEIPQSDAEFNIDKAVLDGKIWVFTISHGGGCDPNYNFQFYAKPKITYDCYVDTIHVVLKTKDNCKRLDYTDVRFDLNATKNCIQKIVFKGGKKDFEILVK